MGDSSTVASHMTDSIVPLVQELLTLLRQPQLVINTPAPLTLAKENQFNLYSASGRPRARVLPLWEETGLGLNPEPPLWFLYKCNLCGFGTC